MRPATDVHRSIYFRWWQRSFAHGRGFRNMHHQHNRLFMLEFKEETYPKDGDLLKV
jgi:hypothetical protein